MQDIIKRVPLKIQSLVSLLVICSTLLFIGLWDLPPIDRDEARFAQATKQMVYAKTKTDYLIPRIQSKPRLNKPPLIYWLQMASVKAGIFIGDTDITDLHKDISVPMTRGIGWYRLPSVLAAIGTALTLWWLGNDMFPTIDFSIEDKRFQFITPGWIVGLLICGSFMVTLDGRQARADQLMIFFNTVTMAAYFKIWNERTANRSSLRTAIIMWIAAGLSIMAKGFITPIILLFTTTTLCIVRTNWKWVRHLYPIQGGIIIVLIVSPWIIGVANEIGFSTYWDIIYSETIGRSMSTRDSHWGPFGYYLLLLPLFFWPGSLLVILALTHPFKGLCSHYTGTWHRKIRYMITSLDNTTLFCFAWLAPGWIFFESIATKLPHYVLPLYPALALLSVRALGSYQKEPHAFFTKLFRASFYIWLFFTILIAIVVPVAGIIIAKVQTSSITWLALSILLVFQCFLVMKIWTNFSNNKLMYILCNSFGILLIFNIITFKICAPAMTNMWLSSRVVAHLNQLDPQQIRPVISAKYKEDSMIFLTDGHAKTISDHALEDELRNSPNAYVVIPEYRKAWKTLHLKKIREVYGFNYTNGKWHNLLIMEQTGITSKGIAKK